MKISTRRGVAPNLSTRCSKIFRWLGIPWSEGPDCGGPYAPYTQSERREFYLEAWRRLRDSG